MLYSRVRITVKRKIPAVGVFFSIRRNGENQMAPKDVGSRPAGEQQSEDAGFSSIFAVF
jgi:hypothetical protein